MISLDEAVDWNKGDGLVPAVIQHAVTGRVLMLGYMNREALQKTQTTGLVTFFSRSRERLWIKGETSGNQLALKNIQLDCDGDTLLVTATPTGPTCHLGKISCFDAETETPGFGFLGQLETVIATRLKEGPAESYTAQLAEAGIQRIAQKIGEEGVEVALAAVQGDKDEIIAESADLIYHLLVLLKYRSLSISDAVQRLVDRH